MQKILIILSLVFIMNLYPDDTNLPLPYKNVKLLPQNSQGWFFNDAQIKKLFKERKISTVIELGSWLGKSTIFIANLLDEKGKLYAVDHWQGSIEHQNCSGIKNFLPSLYDQFLSNIIHAKLTHKIIPIKATTYEAAFTLDVKADLIYLDAAHDEKNVFQDIYYWYPKLKPGGIMCGDDWAWGTVRNAVKKYAKVHNLEIVSDNFFWYYKPKNN